MSQTQGELPPATAGAPPRAARLRLWYLLPLLAFGGLAVALYFGLGRSPEELPSTLIGQPVPEFALPPLPPRSDGLSDEDFAHGEVVVVNVFASWCGPCRLEHPLLVKLAEQFPIYGINYKDRPEDARKFLDELGDPYARIGVDESGRAAIDWGVYGVPETFVVDGEGRIRHKHIGYLTAEAVNETLRPLIEELSR
jgi:cytochrome c biogenesis protein CcmG/thiol:disulfide interchange protein DsbE